MSTDNISERKREQRSGPGRQGVNWERGNSCMNGQGGSTVKRENITPGN